MVSHPYSGRTNGFERRKSLDISTVSTQLLSINRGIHAKTSDEFRRAAIDKLEAFILASPPEVNITLTPNDRVN